MAVMISMDSNGKPKRKDELTCVQLSRATKAKLDKLGTKTDTYEKIILKIMDSQCAVNGESEEIPDE